MRADLVGRSRAGPGIRDDTKGTDLSPFGRGCVLLLEKIHRPHFGHLRIIEGHQGAVRRMNLVFAQFFD